jgi:hypothetical protein
MAAVNLAVTGSSTVFDDGVSIPMRNEPDKI